MEIAYILIQCDLGSEEQIIKEIMKIPDVKEVREHMESMMFFAKYKQILKRHLIR